MPQKQPSTHSRQATAHRWWAPDHHSDKRLGLLLRNKIKSTIRRWFEDQGFIEVDTACLQISPGNETHLHAFSTKLVDSDLSERTRYLHTSPEFALKKLLAAGEKKIFSFAPVFRNREQGALHHPEFTMLEWYRAEQSMIDVMNDCQQILRLAQAESEQNIWQWRDAACDVTAPIQTVSLEDAFLEHLGFRLSDSLRGADLKPDRDLFAKQAAACGQTIGDDETWSDIFSRCLLTIEEQIWRNTTTHNVDGLQRPVFLTNYPAQEAPLAKPLLSDPKFAERFELFVAGVELANGYGELTEPSRLKDRLESEMTSKQSIYGERYPIDDDFIDAASSMPEAAGCAMGFDRLAMLAMRADHIEKAIWTPIR